MLCTFAKKDKLNPRLKKLQQSKLFSNQTFKKNLMSKNFKQSKRLWQCKANNRKMDLKRAHLNSKAKKQFLKSYQTKKQKTQVKKSSW